MLSPFTLDPACVNIQGSLNHLLIWVLFILFDVGDGLRPNPVGNLVGAQGDSKDVLVVAVLILGGWGSKGEEMVNI